MNNETLKQHFHSLGFELDELPDFGFGFEYEGIHYLISTDENDFDCIQLCVPHIYDVNEDNRTDVNEVVNNLNCRLKYTKTVATDDGVWMMYEHFVAMEDNLEDVLEHMIKVLQASVVIFYRKIEGEDGTNEDEDE